MSIETHQHTFEVGDLVWADSLGDYATVGHLTEGSAWVKTEGGSHHIIAQALLEPVVCEYCGSRKGCTCQEDIDAREADWFPRQMDAAERDHWTEDKDRRADEEGL